MLTSREREVVDAAVAALLRDVPPLGDDTREQVVRDVAVFLAAQIAGMPSTLRVPYRAALAAFDLLPLLRYGRPFHLLENSAQVAWLDLWGERGGLPTRSFVKLLRSCVLFAYFDHPVVVARLEAAARPEAAV
jgi:hypothetical protein